MSHQIILTTNADGERPYSIITFAVDSVEVHVTGGYEHPYSALLEMANWLGAEYEKLEAACTFFEKRNAEQEAELSRRSDLLAEMAESYNRILADHEELRRASGLPPAHKGDEK